MHPEPPKSQPPSGLRNGVGAEGGSTELRAGREANPDVVVRIDERGQVLEIRARQHSGAAGERLSVRDVEAKHLTPEFIALARHAIATQTLRAVEYTIGTAGGVRCFEARLAPVMETQAVVFIRDITSRQHSDDERFASREMLRSILDTVPQRVFWKDTASVFLGCNPSVAQDLGYADPSLIVGKTDFDTSARWTAERFRADDREVMRTDQPKLNYEEPHEQLDGSRRWLRTSKVPLHDKEGRVVGVLGTYEDITERKNAELLQAGQNSVLEMIVSGAPLRDTLQRLVQVMESLSHGMQCTILLADEAKHRLWLAAAPSLPEAFNRAVDGTVVGENCGACGTAAARRAPVIVTDLENDPVTAKYTELGRQFGIRSCWSTPIMSRHDEVLGTFAMYFGQSRAPTPAETQLTHVASRLAGIAIQRKQAEDALRKAEEKYRNIFEHALDGIFQITPEGRIVEANPAFARMFGFESPAALVAGVHDVAEQLCVQPARYAEFVQVLQAKGIVQRWEMPMRRRDGQTVWVSLDARIASADGRMLCFEGIAKDVTERKRLEQQFVQAQKMEAFGQLAGGVAHDFNNLLTVILGNLSMLQLSDLTAPQRQSSLDDCLRAAERAANLTGQLLTFSRRSPLESRDVDLNEVVCGVTKMLRRLIGEHIAIDALPAPGGAPVRADPGLLEQAVMNLAVNARDAMPKGGRLTLALAAVDLDAAAAWASSRARPGSFVRLTVTDTGSGITPEHLPHIFEPFYTTKAPGKGTGLGLAMVFGIVEQHEGWIDVESEVGRGTTMTIYLPRLVNGAASFPAPALTDVPQGGSETLLVVEDETDVRKLMCRLLETHGYRVFSAANGPEALALWRQIGGSVDLLITDMVMPGGIGGRELAEQLRTDRPELKVIYCTGYMDEVFKSDGSPGFRDVLLEKPFDVHVFLDRVRRSLDTRTT